MGLAELDGLGALVTGGASGIGARRLRCWPRAGRRSRSSISTRPAAGRCYGVRADVRDDAAVRAAVDDAAAYLGGIDILINNAGIGAVGTVADNPDDQWHQVFDVNVRRHGPGDPRGPALPAPLADRAAIVNTCSIAAIAGLPQRRSTRRPRARSCRSRWPWPPTIFTRASG